MGVSMVLRGYVRPFITKGWVAVPARHHSAQKGQAPYNPTCACPLFYIWKLWHLSHCPNLAPSDPQLFKVLKEHLASKQFVTDGDVKQVVTSWLWTLGINFSAR